MYHPPSLQHCRLVFIRLSSSFIAVCETFILWYKLPTNQQFSPVSAFTLSIHNTIFETKYIWTINGINSLIRVIYTTGNNISQFTVLSSIKSDGRWCSDHYLLRLDTVLWEIIECCKKVVNHHELDQVVMLLKLQH